MNFREKIAAKVLVSCILEHGDYDGFVAALKIAQGFADFLCKEWGHEGSDDSLSLARDLPRALSDVPYACERCGCIVKAKVP